MISLYAENKMLQTVDIKAENNRHEISWYISR